MIERLHRWRGAVAAIRAFAPGPAFDIAGAHSVISRAECGIAPRSIHQVIVGPIAAIVVDVATLTEAIIHRASFVADLANECAHSRIVVDLGRQTGVEQHLVASRLAIRPQVNARRRRRAVAIAHDKAGVLGKRRAALNQTGDRGQRTRGEEQEDEESYTHTSITFLRSAKNDRQIQRVRRFSRRRFTNFRERDGWQRNRAVAPDPAVHIAVTEVAGAHANR